MKEKLIEAEERADAAEYQLHLCLKRIKELEEENFLLSQY